MAQQGRELFDMLKKDHRQVEQMMKQIEAASPDDREEIFNRMQESLQEHMRIEEKEFYPRLKNLPDFKDLVKDALHEHQEAKELMADMEDLEADSEDWDDTFQKLQEGLQHHIQDEEKEIFPLCTKKLSEQQLAEMTEKCLREKEKLHPSRPAAGGKGKTPGRKQPQL